MGLSDGRLPPPRPSRLSATIAVDGNRGLWSAPRPRWKGTERGTGHRHRAGERVERTFRAAATATSHRTGIVARARAPDSLHVLDLPPPLVPGQPGRRGRRARVRSAQPTSQLPDWIREYRIRSILNLRGGNSADWWYEAEVNAARGGGVTFYDFPISATKRPTRRELLVLIDTLRSCTYPLLIHCKSGADRTGLASALYMMVERNPAGAGRGRLHPRTRTHSVVRSGAPPRAASRVCRLARPPRTRPFSRSFPRLGQE